MVCAGSCACIVLMREVVEVVGGGYQGAIPANVMGMALERLFVAL